MNTIHNLFKTLGIIGILFAVSFSAIAQSGTPLPKFNILDDVNLVLETTKLNEFDYQFKIIDKSQEGKSETFVVMPFKEEAFINAFKKAIQHLLSDGNASETSKAIIDSTPELDRHAKMAFIFVQSAGITSSTLSDAPPAGKMCLNESIEVRQDLRVNSNQMRVHADRFLLIKLRRNKSLLSGKVVSAYLSNPKFNKSTESSQEESPAPLGKHKVNPSDIPENCRDFISDKKQWILVSKKKVTEKPTFESFEKEAQGLNRLDYLAAKSLTSSNNEQVRNRTEAIRIQEEKIGRLEKNIASSEKQLNILNSKTAKLDSILLEKLILVKRELQLRNAFNELSSTIGYELVAKGLIIRNVEPYLSSASWRNRLDTLSVEQARERNSGIRPQMLLEISDQQKLVEIWGKMVSSVDANKNATSTLSPNDKAILTFFYIPEMFTDNPGKKTLMKVIDEINVIEIRRFSISEESTLEDLIRRRDATDSAVKILDEYSVVQKLMAEVDGSISTMDTKEQIEKEVKSLLKSVEIDSIEIGGLDSSIAKFKLERKEFLEQSPLRKFIVEYATMEFNQGFIENIVVFGKIEGTNDCVKFTNVQPIGFSRKRDYDNLKNCDLWTEPVANGDKTQFSMNLGDLIENYQQNLALNRRDYSPADGVKRFDVGKEKCTELKKAPSYQLIEAKVFSDFVGLDPSAPNGLIQTEIGHKVCLNTNRLGEFFRTPGGVLGNHGRMKYSSRNYYNYGIFGYIHPSITISKIENNNRSLFLSSKDRILNNQYFQERFTSTLQLRNYEFFSVGAELNGITLDMPSAKSTLYFDFGFRFGRTQVIDSVRALIDGSPENTDKGSEFGVNTFRYYPKITWDIKPEERYGLSVAYAWNQFYLWNPNVTQVSVPARFSVLGENDSPFGYGTAELQAYFNPSVDNPTGKLFFRYTFNHQGSNWNTNFHQAQVGYSFFFLGRNKERTQPD